MRWEDGRESDQVEDRRGFGGGRFAIGGCGTLIVVLVISLLTGANPLRILQIINGGTATQTDASRPPAGPSGGQEPGASDPQKKFVSVVLASTEDTWSSIFSESGREYVKPTLVLFTDATPTACGYGQAAQGPFYCPQDGKVYLDLSFFDELARLDFARAYVVAHEVGHHVQNLLGTERKVAALRERASEREANDLSVRLELQADCYAGVWGNRGARSGLIEPGDAEAGLRAAAAIGDDRLQKMSTGRVQPESFTHGSSAQRVEWLRRGLESGDPGACRTF